MNLILNNFGHFQWANFPPIHCKGDEESCSQTEKSVELDDHEAAEVKSSTVEN